MNENETIEYVETYTEKIYEEIIAFLNTTIGTIFIGFFKNGDLKGLVNSKEIEEKISNEINFKISPNAKKLIAITTNVMHNKEYIAIKVYKGTDIYYLKDKGIMEGTYLRLDSASILASKETIKKMILTNVKLSFETSISDNQNLTFDYIKKAFEESKIDIDNTNTKKELRLVEDKKYTNLALLLSDQNPFSYSLAVYTSKQKEEILDRKEFNGSVLKIYDNVTNYLKTNIETYGLIKKNIQEVIEQKEMRENRLESIEKKIKENIEQSKEKDTKEDLEEYPEFILREILLNSIIHREYIENIPNIVNIYKEEAIEFINYGTIYSTITKKDMLSGLSASRNSYLQSIFTRIKRVNAIGSGIKKVSSYYKTKELTFKIKVLPTSFIIEIPVIKTQDYINSKTIEIEKIKIKDNYTNDEYEVDKQIILKFIEKNNYIVRKEAEELIDKEKIIVNNILKRMTEENILKKIGNGSRFRKI